MFSLLTKTVAFQCYVRYRYYSNKTAVCQLKLSAVGCQLLVLSECTSHESTLNARVAFIGACTLQIADDADLRLSVIHVISRMLGFTAFNPTYVSVIFLVVKWVDFLGKSVDFKSEVGKPRQRLRGPRQ